MSSAAIRRALALALARREAIGAIEDAALRARAVEHFGVTSNPAEAGYILPDGTMLDLSGRHEMLGGDYEREGLRNVLSAKALRRNVPDYQSGRRDIDHRDLPDELSPLGAESATQRMLDFQRNAYALRVTPRHGVSSNFIPTMPQIERTARSWRSSFPEDDLEIDFDDPVTGSAVLDRRTISRPTVERIAYVYDELRRALMERIGE